MVKTMDFIRTTELEKLAKDCGNKEIRFYSIQTIDGYDFSKKKPIKKKETRFFKINKITQENNIVLIELI